MPTSKRMMNPKRWKQPKIIDKRSDYRLGLKTFLRQELLNSIRVPAEDHLHGRTFRVDDGLKGVTFRKQNPQCLFKSIVDRAIEPI